MDRPIPLYILLKRYAEAENKNDYFEEFYTKFEPLLIKYARKLGEDDTKYMLSEALYDALEKIPHTLEQFQEDRYIVSYISKAIFAEYIKISKFNNRGKKNMSLEAEVVYGKIQNTDGFADYHFNQLLASIYSVLTKSERYIFELKFLLGYTDSEIGEILSITRQAVNKRVNKIRVKVKQNINTNDYN